MARSLILPSVQLLANAVTANSINYEDSQSPVNRLWLPGRPLLRFIHAGPSISQASQRRRSCIGGSPLQMTHRRPSTHKCVAVTRQTNFFSQHSPRTALLHRPFEVKFDGFLTDEHAQSGQHCPAAMDELALAEALEAEDLVVRLQRVGAELLLLGRCLSNGLQATPDPSHQLPPMLRTSDRAVEQLIEILACALKHEGLRLHKYYPIVLSDFHNSLQ